MKNQCTILISMLLLSYSCAENATQENFSADGVWLQLGYGKIFEIKNDSVKIFDVCESGCQLYEHVPLLDQGKLESFSKDSLTIRKNIKTYKFVRLNERPDFCNHSTFAKNDPLYNFEVLWHTFNEHYCYFEERNVDWEEVYALYNSKISKETTQLELFQIFDEMLNLLNDGHVDIAPPDLLKDTLEVLEERNQKIGKEKPKVNRFELAEKIARQYCEEIKSHNSGIVKWGMMKDDIAYIQINAMVFLAYYDLPKNLPLNEFGRLYGAEMDKRIFQRQDEIDGADILMDTIMHEMKDAKAIVIDLRINTGGKDEAGLEFIGHFVDSKIKIASKKAKKDDGFTNHQDIFMEPRTPNYLENVYILTSGMTASAAELAVLATLPNDRFIRIGSNTEGSFSDGLDKRLPNGWEYRLSNELYFDYEGNNYEGIGIRPDLDIGYPRDNGAMINMIFDQLNDSGDKAIEIVFELEAIIRKK